MVQLGGFLGDLLGALLKAGLSLMKKVLTLLIQSLLVPLGSTAAASPTDAAKIVFWIEHAHFGLSKANNINNFKQRNG